MFDALERADRHLRARFPAPSPTEPVRSPGRKALRRQRRAHRALEQYHHRIRAKQRHPPLADVDVLPAILLFAFAGLLLFYAATRGSALGLFAGLGLVVAGAAQLAQSRRAVRRGAPVGAQVTATQIERAGPAPMDEEAARVDEIAGKLTEELRTGPVVLREIVRDPATAIEALRKGHHALAQRELTLRTLVDEAQEIRLRQERAHLVARRAETSDAIAQARFDEAIAALDQQRLERAAVIAAADRLEAERIRLRYSLETLLAQVIRARTTRGTEAQVDDGVLRETLQRLTDEIGAVADALDSVDDPRP